MITGYERRQRFKKRLLICAAAVYAVAGIYTFGFIYNRMDCLTKPTTECADYKAAASLLAAVFWPLTISAIAQEGVE